MCRRDKKKGESALYVGFKLLMARSLMKQMISASARCRKTQYSHG